MKKFDEIIIGDYQPNLKFASLNNLGRINVLCGKNGSGKSTILNALNELSKKNIPNSDDEAFYYIDHQGEFTIDTRRTQFSINEFNINKIQKIDQIYYVEYEENRVENKAFTKGFVFNQLKEFLERGALKDLSIDKSAFIGEFREFLSSTGFYENYYDEDMDSHFILPVNIIEELADQIFPSRKSVKLISTDRHLPDTCKIKDYKSCDYNGERILNYIHFCKSQLPTSERHKNFLALKTAFYELSEGYNFELVMNPDLDLELLFSNREGQWINAEKSGLGLRDLLVILSHIILTDRDIFLIEEPERHLHSSTQRRLLMYLSEQDKQFFIATHSNVFLDLDFVDAIFTTEYINGSINVKNESSKAQALIELGYSVADNIVSDLIILTEGPSDKNVVEYFLKELGLLKSKIVKFWFLGGDIMTKVDLTVLMESYKVIALIDNDPGSTVIRTRFVRKCESLGIRCHRLEKYSIENYLTLEALRKQFPKQIPPSLSAIDPNVKLEKQIGGTKVKEVLGEIVKHMNFSDIENTDLGKFILEIKQLLEQKAP